MASWWFQPTPTLLANISQWEGLSHISWKITNDWNHQPNGYWTFTELTPQDTGKITSQCPYQKCWLRVHHMFRHTQVDPNRMHIYIYIGINMGINSHIPEYSKKHLLTLANHGLRRCHHGCLDERLTGDVRKNDNRLTTWVVWLNEWFHMHGHSMDIYIYIWIYMNVYIYTYLWMMFLSINNSP